MDRTGVLCAVQCSAMAKATATATATATAISMSVSMSVQYGDAASSLCVWAFAETEGFVLFKLSLGSCRDSSAQPYRGADACIGIRLVHHLVHLLRRIFRIMANRQRIRVLVLHSCSRMLQTAFRSVEGHESSSCTARAAGEQQNTEHVHGASTLCLPRHLHPEHGQVDVAEIGESRESIAGCTVHSVFALLCAPQCLSVTVHRCRVSTYMYYLCNYLIRVSDHPQRPPDGREKLAGLLEETSFILIFYHCSIPCC
jgi:hypothetical protein